ncbi:S-adenosylmethionine decarboxylase proenzyme [Golovinomyces cichoracearum]|uniref:adenosylmethionine decarboxylase n=1 Tax=Golovinomyces cichoracearum TaxID=62708 RepID=A0A420I348_9PEZI|nr:S-adenosylmethionine decarboxylase proenzyme [Golovinomyces cichoracearum]
MFDHDVPASYNPSIFKSNSVTSTGSDVIMAFDTNNAFEGPEKLLEVWFAPAPDALPAGVKAGGLKAVPAEIWKEMLSLVNCKVLSIIESEIIDAYLLSESSMFVFPHKLILKTCGTTTLLLGLPCMLNIATKHAGYPESESPATHQAIATPYRVFYSRKNFLFPDKQHGPHRCWEKEVEFLDNIFEGGSAYMVGKMNGDHWYLYLTSPNTNIKSSEKSLSTNQSNPEFRGFQSRINNDETLEILMMDLDQENAKQFYTEHANSVAASKSMKNHQTHDDLTNSLSVTNGYLEASGEHESKSAHCSYLCKNNFGSNSKVSDTGLLTPVEGYSQDEIDKGHALGAIVAETCGLTEVYSASKYPHARVESHLFSPCGFSANGVIPATDSPSAHYFTVHVTPEPHCSYASFETNVPARQTGHETIVVVEQVVNIFKPGRFCVTLFEAKAEPAEDSCDVDLQNQNNCVSQHRKDRDAKMIDNIKGYRRIDRILHEFDGYDLVFRYFERDDSQVGVSQ